MNARRSPPPSESSVVADTLHVLIAFDDLPAYKRALRLLVRVLIREGVNLRPIPWRFDWLEGANSRSLAADDAVRADVLIVSTSNTIAPPLPVRAWLEDCASTSKNSKALLVALLGLPGQAADEFRPFHEFLRRIAAATGHDFLAPEVSLVETTTA